MSFATTLNVYTHVTHAMREQVTCRIDWGIAGTEPPPKEAGNFGRLNKRDLRRSYPSRGPKIFCLWFYVWIKEKQTANRPLSYEQNQCRSEENRHFQSKMAVFMVDANGLEPLAPARQANQVLNWLGNGSILRILDT